MITYEEAELLYKLARETKGDCIVEVGSYRGRSAVELGLGSLNGNKVPVYAIDPHEKFTGVLGGQFGPRDRGAFYSAMLQTGCYQIVRLVNLSSEIVTSKWPTKIGLLWLDGDHTYSGVKTDFECWLPHLTGDALVVFDDSTNPGLGPAQLIKELVCGSEFAEIDRVGKITVIARREVGAN